MSKTVTNTDVSTFQKLRNAIYHTVSQMIFVHLLIFFQAKVSVFKTALLQI